MNWNNLKILTCPKCESDLNLDKSSNKLICSDCKAFQISVDKLKKIVGSMYMTARDYYGQAEFEELLKATLDEGGENNG